MKKHFRFIGKLLAYIIVRMLGVPIRRDDSVDVKQSENLNEEVIGNDNSKREYHRSNKGEE